MNIRPATLDDWPTLSVLVEEFNIEKRAKFDEPDYTRMQLDAIHMAIAGEHGGVYVAEQDGQLVGYAAWLSFPTMPVGIVDGIGTYVLPELRRERIAEALNLAAIDFWKSRGMKRVYGVVHNANEPSMKRMRAYGAEPVGTLFRWDLDREPKHGG